MDVKFKYQDPAPVEKIYIEQVFAEVPGGGMISNPAFSAPASTAVGEDSNGKLKLIKGYKVVEAAASGATTIKIEKGSGIVKGDVLATGKKGVACTAVDTTTSPDYDVVTISMGVALKAGQVLYQAKEASADAAQPIYAPKYVIGNRVPANEGDFPVRLLNGANLRKETAMVAPELVEMMKSIALV
ncbi:MAG: hypothetical protein MJZ26_09090 [Fibrobacter sp.]|nr:hypothetical protein [Fibrobacter sp.]